MRNWRWHQFRTVFCVTHNNCAKIQMFAKLGPQPYWTWKRFLGAKNVPNLCYMSARAACLPKYDLCAEIGRPDPTLAKSDFATISSIARGFEPGGCHG